MVDTNSKTETKQNRRRGRKGDINKNTSKSLLEKKHNHHDSFIPQDDKSNAADAVHVAGYQPHNQLLIKLDDDTPTWFTFGNQLEERDATVVTHPPSDTGLKNTSRIVSKYRTLADVIYQREVHIFGKNSSETSDNRWVESTMKRGTLKDRIAAMSVVVSTEPVHKFQALDGLLQMMGCSISNSSQRQQPNSRVAQLAAEATEDLFLNTFLPPNRKLLSLAQRPLYLYESQTGSEQIDQERKGSGSKSSGKKKNKTKHTLSPRILLLWRFEELVKERYDLFLRQYLSQTLHESMELQKISAIRTASNLLRSVPEGETELLQMISNKIGDPSKKVCAAAGHELRKVLLQHPAMITVISREVQQLAHRPHLSSKALYNCIIFLNQLKLSSNDINDKEASTSLPCSLISTYFRLFEVAVKQPNDKKEKDSESGMKSRLLSALLTGVNRAHPYLPAKDKNMEEHIDALYRVVHTAPPAACTQSLLLLFHLAVGSELETQNSKSSKTQPNSKQSTDTSDGAVSRKERFYRALYSTLSQPEMVVSGKHLTMYFNLLYKAMKYDTVTSRIVCFAKKLLSFTIHFSSAIAAASIFLLNEVCKAHPILLTCYDEVFSGPDASRVLDPVKREPRGALVSIYDGKFTEDDDEKRSPGWELTLAQHHFHPSVQLFAKSIGQDIDYSGDPLKDFSLAPFLDKFAYRNPKSVERVASKFKRGESIAERKSGTDSIIQAQFALPVNDPSFLELAKKDVHDEFFLKFFKERANRDSLTGITKDTNEKPLKEDEIKVINNDEDGKVDSKYDTNFDWETDSEEEDFVDSLAQKILEDSSGAFGPNELDDEDPDMDDWDSIEDKDTNIDDNQSYENQKVPEDDQSLSGNDDSASDDDIDAFMDGDELGTSSSDDDEDSGPNFLEDEHVFSQDEDASDVDVSDDVFVEEKKSKQKKTKTATPTFAAAEDYEALISSTWKRPLKEDATGDKEVGNIDKLENSKSERKKKKRIN